MNTAQPQPTRWQKRTVATIVVLLVCTLLMATGSLAALMANQWEMQRQILFNREIVTKQQRCL